MNRARRFVRNRAALIGGVIAVALVAIAVLAPWLTADPFARDLDHGLSPLGAPLPPSGEALFGTDHLGRDVWARVVAAARTSLAVAALATTVAVSLGVAVGLTAGYLGGWVDALLMRGVDLVLAFPVVLVAILLAALLRETSVGTSTVPLVITLGALTWPSIARVVRAKTLVLARSPHVAAARALGASTPRILSRHVLPNALGVVVVFATLGFAQNLLFESVLSYLGLGPPPPEPTWGRMVYEGRLYYRTAPHLLLAPGAAILLAVVAFNLVGEGLRGAFDPKEPR